MAHLSRLAGKTALLGPRRRKPIWTTIGSEAGAGHGRQLSPFMAKTHARKHVSA
jgi:hypothetical protein